MCKMRWNIVELRTHKHTHTVVTVLKTLPGFVLHLNVRLFLYCCVSLSLIHEVAHTNTWHRFTCVHQHKCTQTKSFSHTHKLIYTHHAAPHFCLGKKVITFSPCLNAFKSLSGAIPRWASEIHLNSFWESKQSYCCALKLWLEREKKWEVEEEGAEEDW